MAPAVASQSPSGQRVRPASSPGPRTKARPQSAVGGPRKHRPSSAPAITSRRINQLAEAKWLDETQEPIGKDWIQGDWSAGWKPDPFRKAFPRWSIPSNSRGRGESAGFRDTYACQVARNKAHIPGPGAHKALRDFCEPSTSDSYGKPENTRKEKRWTPRHLQTNLEDSGANREAPDTGGDETDAKRLNRSRPASARIPNQARNASLTDLRQAKPNSLPSSFHTPGPGAYTQFSCFGQPSGACSKGYLGKSLHDNPAMRKYAKDGGSTGALRSTRRTATVSGKARAHIRVAGARGFF